MLYLNKMKDEELPFQPPEPKYVTEKHVVKVLASDEHLNNPWELRKYAEALLENRLGDNVQLTSLKVKSPSFLMKRLLLLFHRKPMVKLKATIKF